MGSEDPLTKGEIYRLKSWFDSRQGGWVKEIGLKVLTTLEQVERERAAIMHQVQLRQPAGSPPPGDSLTLAIWILRTLEERAEKAERDAKAQGSEDRKCNRCGIEVPKSDIYCADHEPLMGVLRG